MHGVEKNAHLLAAERIINERPELFVKYTPGNVYMIDIKLVYRISYHTLLLKESKFMI